MTAFDDHADLAVKLRKRRADILDGLNIDAPGVAGDLEAAAALETPRLKWRTHDRRRYLMQGKLALAKVTDERHSMRCWQAYVLNEAGSLWPLVDEEGYHKKFPTEAEAKAAAEQAVIQAPGGSDHE